jgi:hypothetical protein
LDLPFTTWSLTKLAGYLGEHARVEISAESVCQIMHAPPRSVHPDRLAARRAVRWAEARRHV